LRTLIVLLGIAGLSLGPSTQEPVRFWASLSQRSLEVGERVRLELHFESQRERPDQIETPPIPPGLELVSVNEYNQYTFSLPGGRRQLFRRELVLRALEVGEHTIPPARAWHEGEEYQTEELLLEVVESSGTPPSSLSTTYPDPVAQTTGRTPMTLHELTAGNTGRGPRDEVILRVRAEPDTIYQGQQITLYAQVWISDQARLRLRRAPEYHPPNVDGLWTHDLPHLSRTGRRLIDDRAYRVQEFHRAYFPLEPGHYELPPAKLFYEVRRTLRYESDEQEIETEPIPIVVLPFPEEGRPTDFAGAVGEFDITASIEPSRVPAGEATALTVEITGRGQIETLPAPTIPELPYLEFHPPTSETWLDESGRELRGTKRFTWIVVPREGGEIQLPPIEYPYFDPQTAEYQVAQSRSLDLTVTVDESEDEVLRTKTETERTETRPQKSLFELLRENAPLILLGPALALLGIGVVRWRRTAAVPIEAVPETPPPPSRWRRRKMIRELKAEVGQPDADPLYRLDQMVREEIGARIGFHGPIRSGTQTIARELETIGLSTPTIETVTRLLTSIERARYQPGPVRTEQLLELIDQTERVLEGLDSELD